MSIRISSSIRSSSGSRSSSTTTSTCRPVAGASGFTGADEQVLEEERQRRNLSPEAGRC